MIQGLHQVMLYVDDQKQSVDFRKGDLSFSIISEEELPEGFKAIEIAPAKSSGTSIVLFDKAFIKKYSPEVSLEPPSLMFRVDNIETLYKDMKDKGVTVGEMVEQTDGRVFNFADREENHFAVMDVKKIS